MGFVLAPYAALLLRMSLSRRREYLADASAAEILNDPEAMALALNRLELDTTSVRYADASTAHLWVESPTDRVDSERRGIVAMSGLFNTHPPLRTRIAALEERAIPASGADSGARTLRRRARPRVATGLVSAQSHDSIQLLPFRVDNG